MYHIVAETARAITVTAIVMAVVLLWSYGMCLIGDPSNPPRPFKALKQELRRRRHN